MENDFNRQLILKVVCNTLFGKCELDKNELYFSEDFIQEQSSFIYSNNLDNIWLRVNIVQVLFELGLDNRSLLRNFYLDNFFILRNLINFQNKGIVPSHQQISEYVDIKLDIFYDEEVVDGILIDCIGTKLEDLTAISDEYLIKKYIEKEDFNELIEFYLS